MSTYETLGYYGSNHTPCTVLIAEDSSGMKWYCVEGSATVNATYDDIGLGVDVEELSDVDVFTWPDGIDSLETLEAAIEA